MTADRLRPRALTPAKTPCYIESGLNEQVRGSLLEEESIMFQRSATVLAIGFSLVMAGCTSAEPSGTTEATAAPGAEATLPAAADEIYVEDCTRAETVIFDIDGGQSPAPELWNPYVPGVQNNVGMKQAVMEPLFIYSIESNEQIPWQGLEMTPDTDAKDVWTLKLRPGVMWSDGEPMNADDVIFTINMLIDNAPELKRSSDIQERVERVDKIDDLTVRFYLKESYPRFVGLFNGDSTEIWMVPKHIWEGQDPLTFTAYDPDAGLPVYSGAYKVVSVSPSEFVYVRDDNWWGAQSGFRELPEPRCLIWTTPGSNEAKASLMINHELDSLMDIDPGTWESIHAANPNAIAWKPDAPWAWVDDCERNIEILNEQNPPWDSPEMRTAFSFVLDRQEIADVGYQHTTEPSRSIFPAYPGLDDYLQLAEDAGLYDKYPVGTHDSEAAAAILEGLGWVKGDSGYYEKDGETLSITLQTASDFIEYQRLVQVAVEQLQAFGIDAQMQSPSEATTEENYITGNFSAMMNGATTCASHFEPWSSMDTLSNRWYVPIGERADANGQRWNNQEYSDLVAELGTLEQDDPRYNELFLKAYEIFLREQPVIPVVQARKLVPFDTTYWTGWPTIENKYFSPTTWWAGAHIIIHSLVSTSP